MSSLSSSKPTQYSDIIKLPMSSLAQFYRTILRITKQPKPTVFRSTVHASFALTHSI